MVGGDIRSFSIGLFVALIYSYTLKITNSRDMLANTRNLLALIASMHTMGVVAFFQYGISLR